MKEKLIVILVIILFFAPMLIGCKTTTTSDGTVTSTVDLEALAQSATLAQQVLLLTQQGYEAWLAIQQKQNTLDQASVLAEQAARQQQIAFLTAQAELILGKLPLTMQKKVKSDASELATITVNQTKRKVKKMVSGN